MLAPLRMMAPVGSEVIMVSGLLGERGAFVARESIEGSAKVERVSKIGGEIITPGEIVKAVLEGGAPVHTEFADTGGR